MAGGPGGAAPDEEVARVARLALHLTEDHRAGRGALDARLRALESQVPLSRFSACLAVCPLIRLSARLSLYPPILLFACVPLCFSASLSVNG